MNIQLIQGQFNVKDAIDIITQMMHVKVKFHENKITDNCTEEDIKLSEIKIKRLQKDLFEIRKFVETKARKISLECAIEIQ